MQWHPFSEQQVSGGKRTFMVGRSGFKMLDLFGITRMIALRELHPYFLRAELLSLRDAVKNYLAHFFR